MDKPSMVVRWCVALMPALWRLGQKDKFEDSLHYICELLFQKEPPSPKENKTFPGSLCMPLRTVLY